MRAAVVTHFASPPRYADFERPAPRDGEVRVRVSAAALSPIVRVQSSGKHYSSGTVLPLVPGIDGVGRLDDGRRVYFAFPRAPFGAMAEETVVAAAHVAPIPEELDDVTAAALANPGVSSWAALQERARLVRGESVLVHGATGASGKLAIRIAKHLGAARVVATGRNERAVAPLAAHGADATIALDAPRDALVAQLRAEVARIDVIIDYLWGAPAEVLLDAFVNQGGDDGSRRVRYVQVGSIAGGRASIDAAAIRSSGIELLGSGLKSISRARFFAASAEVLRAAPAAGFTIDTVAAPLADVERAWREPSPARVVLTT